MSNRHQESPGSPQITAPDPPFATKSIPPYRHRRHNAAFDPAFPRALTTTDLALLGFPRPNAASDATPPPPIHQRAVSELHTGWLTQNAEREQRHASIPPTLEVTGITPIQSIEDGSDPYVALERATEDYRRRINRELRRRVRLEDDVQGLDELCEQYEGDFVRLMGARDRYRRERNEERERSRALQAQVQTLTDQLAAAQNAAIQPAGPVRGGGRGGARGGARGCAGRGGRGAAAAVETRKQPQRKCKEVKR